MKINLKLKFLWLSETKQLFLSKNIIKETQKWTIDSISLGNYYKRLFMNLSKIKLF